MQAGEAMLGALRAALAARGGVVVGFSGGVDSAVLAKAAHLALGPRALAVTVDSPSLARRELAEARALAAAHGLRWQAAQAHELRNPLYVANGADRCFHCRDEMSAVLRRVADREGIAAVVMGVQRDDLGDDRPGHEAMRRAGVGFPLLEVGAGKQEVRAMARALGLEVAEKPAAACLSSRIRRGDAVTEQGLRRVEVAEDWLLARGFRVVRVRAEGDRARVEVGPEEVARAQAMAADIAAALRAAGFAGAEVDPRGYRTAAMRAAPAAGP